MTAHDKDCTPKKSDICKYEIVTSDVVSGSDRDGPDGDKPAELPFQIDSEGNIRNTRPLSYEESHNYIFEVRWRCSFFFFRDIFELYEKRRKARRWIVVVVVYFDIFRKSY